MFNYIKDKKKNDREIQNILYNFITEKGIVKIINNFYEDMSYIDYFDKYFNSEKIKSELNKHFINSNYVLHEGKLVKQIKYIKNESMEDFFNRFGNYNLPLLKFYIFLIDHSFILNEGYKYTCIQHNYENDFFWSSNIFTNNFDKKKISLIYIDNDNTWFINRKIKIIYSQEKDLFLKNYDGNNLKTLKTYQQIFLDSVKKYLDLDYLNINYYIKK